MAMLLLPLQLVVVVVVVVVVGLVVLIVELVPLAAEELRERNGLMQGDSLVDACASDCTSADWLKTRLVQTALVGWRAEEIRSCVVFTGRVDRLA